MWNKGGARAAEWMTQSLDNKRSCSTMLWTCLTMGMRPPSLPLLPPRSKPLHLCSILLRMMSLMAAMQLGVLCLEFRGDSWGGERCSLLLLLGVLVDVVVVVVLRKLQMLKDGGGTGHQRCGRCSKATQLGQATLSVWKQRTS